MVNMFLRRDDIQRSNDSKEFNEYSHPITRLEGFTREPLEFRGREYLQISLPLGLSTAILVEDSQEQIRDKKRIENICDKFNLELKTQTYGEYVLENPFFKQHNSFPADKRVMGSEELAKEYEEFIKLNDSQKEFIFSWPVRPYSIDSFIGSGEVLQQDYRNLREAYRNESEIKKGHFTVPDPCGCCFTDVGHRVSHLQKFDFQNRISGFSRITYLAQGVSRQRSERETAAKIYHNQVIEPSRKLFERSLKSAKTNLEYLVENQDS